MEQVIPPHGQDHLVEQVVVELVAAVVLVLVELLLRVVAVVVPKESILLQEAMVDLVLL